jgi:hypothetical protein
VTAPRLRQVPAAMMPVSDRRAALDAIRVALATVDDAKLPALLCALYDHPPVVHSCFGQVTCARCDAWVGDSVAGVYDYKGVAISGHDCANCAAILSALTPVQRLLTPTEADP